MSVEPVPGEDLDAFITRREAYSLMERNAGLINGLRRAMLWLGAILLAGMLLLLALTYLSDRRGCDRAVPLRTAMNRAADYFDGQAQRATQRSAEEPTPALVAFDLRSTAAARQTATDLRGGELDCAKVLP